MRKVIILALAVFLIVFVGGYTILWFGQASAAKQGLQNILNAINKQQPYITYEAIESSGFPQNIVVSIVKPHFSGRMDTLLKSMITDPAQQAQLATMPDWTSDISLDGRIDFGINALSNDYSIKLLGNWLSTAKIKDQSYSTTTVNGDLTCALQTKHQGSVFGKLWDFKALVEDPKMLAQNFRLFDCSSPAYSTIDSATKEPLISTGPQRFYVTQDIVNGQRQLRVYVKLADIEVTPQGDKIFSAYVQALNPQYPFTVNYSLYGKQNLDVDFAMTAPLEWNAAMQDNPVDITLSTLSLTNSISSFNIGMHLANAFTDTSRSNKAAFKLEATFTPQYQTEMQRVVRQLIGQLYSDPHPEMRAAFHITPEFMQKHTADDLYNIISPALPDFQAIGKAVENIDLSTQMDKEGKSGDITLSAFEVSTSLYGISGQGTGKIKAGNPIPTANVTLSCRNCARMIDDAFAYAIRVQKTVAALNPDQPMTPINTQLAEGVKAFLTGLGTASGPDNSTLDFAIVSDGVAPPTVNGKPMDQIMALFTQDIAPQLQQPQPAAH